MTDTSAAVMPTTRSNTNNRSSTVPYGDFAFLNTVLDEEASADSLRASVRPPTTRRTGGGAAVPRPASNSAHGRRTTRSGGGGGADGGSHSSPASLKLNEANRAQKAQNGDRRGPHSPHRGQQQERKPSTKSTSTNEGGALTDSSPFENYGGGPSYNDGGYSFDTFTPLQLSGISSPAERGGRQQLPLSPLVSAVHLKGNGQVGSSTSNNSSGHDVPSHLHPTNGTHHTNLNNNTTTKPRVPPQPPAIPLFPPTKLHAVSAPVAGAAPMSSAPVVASSSSSSRNNANSDSVSSLTSSGHRVAAANSSSTHPQQQRSQQHDGSFSNMDASKSNATGATATPTETPKKNNASLSSHSGSRHGSANYSPRFYRVDRAISSDGCVVAAKGVAERMAASASSSLPTKGDSPRDDSPMFAPKKPTMDKPTQQPPPQQYQSPRPPAHLVAPPPAVPQNLSSTRADARLESANSLRKLDVLRGDRKAQASKSERRLQASVDREVSRLLTPLLLSPLMTLTDPPESDGTAGHSVGQHPRMNGTSTPSSPLKSSTVAATLNALSSGRAANNGNVPLRGTRMAPPASATSATANATRTPAPPPPPSPHQVKGRQRRDVSQLVNTPASAATTTTEKSPALGYRAAKRKEGLQNNTVDDALSPSPRTPSTPKHAQQQNKPVVIGPASARGAAATAAAAAAAEGGSGETSNKIVGSNASGDDVTLLNSSQSHITSTRARSNSIRRPARHSSGGAFDFWEFTDPDELSMLSCEDTNGSGDATTNSTTAAPVAAAAAAAAAVPTTEEVETVSRTALPPLPPHSPVNTYVSATRRRGSSVAFSIGTGPFTSRFASAAGMGSVASLARSQAPYRSFNSTAFNYNDYSFGTFSPGSSVQNPASLSPALKHQTHSNASGAGNNNINRLGSRQSSMSTFGDLESEGSYTNVFLGFAKVGASSASSKKAAQQHQASFSATSPARHAAAATTEPEEVEVTAKAAEGSDPYPRVTSGGTADSARKTANVATAALQAPHSPTQPGAPSTNRLQSRFTSFGTQHGSSANNREISYFSLAEMDEMAGPTSAARGSGKTEERGATSTVTVHMPTSVAPAPYASWFSPSRGGAAFKAEDDDDSEDEHKSKSKSIVSRPRREGPSVIVQPQHLQVNSPLAGPQATPAVAGSGGRDTGALRSADALLSPGASVFSPSHQRYNYSPSMVSTAPVPQMPQLRTEVELDSDDEDLSDNGSYGAQSQFRLPFVSSAFTPKRDAAGGVEGSTATYHRGTAGFDSARFNRHRTTAGDGGYGGSQAVLREESKCLALFTATAPEAIAAMRATTTPPHEEDNDSSNGSLHRPPLGDSVAGPGMSVLLHPRDAADDEEEEESHAPHSPMRPERQQIHEDVAEKQTAPAAAGGGDETEVDLSDSDGRNSYGIRNYSSDEDNDEDVVSNSTNESNAAEDGREEEGGGDNGSSSSSGSGSSADEEEDGDGDDAVEEDDALAQRLKASGSHPSPPGDQPVFTARAYRASGGAASPDLPSPFPTRRRGNNNNGPQAPSPFANRRNGPHNARTGPVINMLPSPGAVGAANAGVGGGMRSSINQFNPAALRMSADRIPLHMHAQALENSLSHSNNTNAFVFAQRRNGGGNGLNGGGFMIPPPLDAQLLSASNPGAPLPGAGAMFFNSEGHVRNATAAQQQQQAIAISPSGSTPVAGLSTFHPSSPMRYTGRSPGMVAGVAMPHEDSVLHTHSPHAPPCPPVMTGGPGSPMMRSIHTPNHPNGTAAVVASHSSQQQQRLSSSPNSTSRTSDWVQPPHCENAFVNERDLRMLARRQQQQQRPLGSPDAAGGPRPWPSPFSDTDSPRRHVGTRWFMFVTLEIRWVPSPGLSPDERGLEELLPGSDDFDEDQPAGLDLE